MIKVCDICRRRLEQYSLLSNNIVMPTMSLFKVILLIALYSCDTLSLPIKFGVPEFEDWLSEKVKPISQQPRDTTLFGPSYDYSPFKSVDGVIKDRLLHEKPKQACGKEFSKILFPLKYRYEDGLTDSEDKALNLVKLPVVKQPYENYKVLVATAPPGLELGGEDGDKPMAVYIVFNDERAYPSPMNLPTVYFVKKRPMTHNSVKDISPILLIDSNRTVTGLRSSAIHKFVKFSNKLNKFADDIQGINNNL